MGDEPTRRFGVAEPVPRELSAGERVGAWTILRTIGSGGFGTVYEAAEAPTDRRVALKLLHAHLVTSPEMVARFEREAQVIGALRHPAIVELVEVGVAPQGQPYFCMELLAGEELSKLIARERALSAVTALAILAPLCDAVATAHDVGIIHRDLKAANVIVSHDQTRVTLLDFGIAKLTDALAPELTASHQSLGTPSCMAPEQIHGRPVDGRTDVYALGGLLFHMLTGHMPFEDVSPTMTQYLHLHAKRPRASTLAHVSPRVDDVIVRAMSIEPADRFSDPRTLLAAARAAMRESTIVRVANIVDTAALLVSVEAAPGASLDEALLVDLEAVLPAAERFLANLGFTPAVDLGSSIVVTKPIDSADEAVSAALAAWQHLAERTRPDPRVVLSILVHRGPASPAATDVQSQALLRPSSWNLPDGAVGVWVTAAIDPAHPGGRRLR